MKRLHLILLTLLIAGAAVSRSHAQLPVTGNAKWPVVLLEAEPLPGNAAAEPGVLHLGGTVVHKEGADSVAASKGEVALAKKGFGGSKVSFRYALKDVPAGDYIFQARWKQGGDPNVCGQTFELWAGKDESSLQQRAKMTLKPGGWTYRRVAGSSLTIHADDTALEVRNSGNAQDGKIFDAFLLAPDPLFLTLAAMPPASAEARRPFLKSLKPVSKPRSRWFLIDTGNPEDGDALFRGLSSKDMKVPLAGAEIVYVSGNQAQEMTRRLNLADAPALVAVDDRFTMLGALVKPSGEKDVEDFLRAGGKRGPLPSVDARPDRTIEPTPLMDGLPVAWLVGGLHDGVAGESIFGIDAEAALRPSPGQPFAQVTMQSGSMTTWSERAPSANGVCLIAPATKHSYGWARGTGYAHLYLHVDAETTAFLHLLQSGIQTVGWLDGKSISVEPDSAVPAEFPRRAASGATTKTGLTTEGLVVTAVAEKAETPRVIKLELKPGWHRLTLKFTMQHEAGEAFFFAAKFTDAHGKALQGITTSTADPQTNLTLHEHASRLRPRFYISAPGNLPHSGEPITLRADIGWTGLNIERTPGTPILPFAARLRLRITDYDGRSIAEHEAGGTFPGQVNVDLGKAPAVGYYAIHPSLHSADGRHIMTYPPDGFAVVGGAVAQRERLEKKKLWNNFYYIAQTWEGLFPWLERSGVWKNQGSYPGWGTNRKPMWDAAKERGIVLFADFIGDSHEVNLKPIDIEKTAQALAPYTRYFKGSNEIDIHMTMPQRSPRSWVQRTQWERDAVRNARPDGLYLGGSLVRPGSGEASGKWFLECLKLGLDKYHDAWDVHCYPKFAPVLEGPIGDAGFEGDRGVRHAYKQVGRENVLPFWIGETGAKACHGADGRRWQADMVAKMIAHANSRADIHAIAFCIAHEYWWDGGRLWDYSMGHQPGEAALSTASALIDGLPYQRVQADDKSIQAARFGDTLMAWCTGRPTSFRTALQGAGPWIIVDVVGRASPLAVDPDGQAQLPLTGSPIYVVSKAGYEQLTRAP